MNLKVITQVRNAGNKTNDINASLLIDNDIIMILGAWTIWDVPPGEWRQVEITFTNIDLGGFGDYKCTVWVWEKATPNEKISDLHRNSIKVGEIYKSFNYVENELDHKEAFFSYYPSATIIGKPTWELESAPPFFIDVIETMGWQANVPGSEKHTFYLISYYAPSNLGRTEQEVLDNWWYVGMTPITTYSMSRPWDKIITDFDPGTILPDPGNYSCVTMIAEGYNQGTGLWIDPIYDSRFDADVVTII